MRLELFKEGSLQGWVINTIWTFFTMTMLGLGFFMDIVRVGWEKYGGIYTTIYLGGMTAWFAYKVANKKIDSGTQSGVQQESIADALKKVVDSMSAMQANLKKD